jgi:spermidine/putrescine transport system permease protein
MVNGNYFSRFFLPTFVGLTYLFLYIPIAVLIIYSFNENALSSQWDGFTTRWYSELFASGEVWDALKNSLLVASISVALSVMFGSLLIFFCARNYISRVVVLFFANLAIPEIVLAVGLLSFFYMTSISLGVTTLIAAHTALGLGYVVPIVYARYEEIDRTLIEASMDLGATEFQTFYKIVLPLLMPAILGAGLLVFVISLDDFVLAFFCSGAGVVTLPMHIFSLVRSGATPAVNALSTLLLVASSLLIMIFSAFHFKKVGMPR